MTRNRQRKIRKGARQGLRLPQERRVNSMLVTGLPLASAIIACLNPAHAQEATPATLEEVVVTAQKRSESLQDVPLSITALGAQQLEDMNAKTVDDYIKYLPSVSYQTQGPSSAKLYMRGVSSGGDGVHDGTVPSVGVYLDEQPVTTIQGVLDIHVYDIASHQLLRTISTHKGLSISFLATMLKPPDLVGHISLSLNVASVTDARNVMPVRPVAAFHRMKDANARELHEVSMMLPITSEVSYLLICVWKGGSTTHPTDITN